MKANEILTEAARYDDMFSSVFDVIGGDPHTKDAVRKKIYWAKTFLRRKDAVTWFLRIYRIALMNELTTDYSEFIPLMDEEIKKYNRKAGENVFNRYTLPRLSGRGKVRYEQSYAVLEDTLEHFSSLPIDEIRDFRFHYEHPSEVIDYFERMEEEWKDSVGEGLVPDRGEKVFLDVGNGYVWFDLQRAACDEESEAMGHCGNSPAAGNPDLTILSLREKKKVNGELFWRVALTFILNKRTGYIGEMKGRGNDKPSEKYHRYIVPLIMDDRIKGLNGGGYLPEHNFDVKDLPNWKQLVEKKPTLLTLQEYINEFGIDESVSERINFTNEVGTINGTTYVIIDHEETGEQIVDWYGNDFARHVLGLTNGTEMFHDAYDVSVSDVYETLDSDQEAAVIELGRKLLERDIENQDVYEINDADDALNYIEDEHHDIWIDISNAFRDGMRLGAEGEAVRSLKNAFFSPDDGMFGLDTDEGNFELHMEPSFVLKTNNTHFLDSTYTVAVELMELLKEIEEEEIPMSSEIEVTLGANPSDDDATIRLEEPSYGYTDFDDYAFAERLNEVIQEHMSE